MIVYGKANVFETNTVFLKRPDRFCAHMRFRSSV